jgi:hypothetical protein
MKRLSLILLSLIALSVCSCNFDEWELEQHKKTLAGSVETLNGLPIHGTLNGLPIGEEDAPVILDINPLNGVKGNTHVSLNLRSSEPLLMPGNIKYIDLTSVELKGKATDVTFENECVIRWRKDAEEYSSTGMVKGWLQNPELYAIQTKSQDPGAFNIKGAFSAVWKDPDGSSHTLVVDRIDPWR